MSDAPVRASLLFQCSSVAALRRSIKSREDGYAGFVFWKAKISMLLFGAFLKKPLCFQGTWVRISVPFGFQQFVSEIIPSRLQVVPASCFGACLENTWKEKHRPQPVVLEFGTSAGLRPKLSTLSEVPLRTSTH